MVNMWFLTRELKIKRVNMVNMWFLTVHVILSDPLFLDIELGNGHAGMFS